ncbi:DUF302 domain-containing protein [Dyella jiangningensis]|jgi:uncharacterized protein (DUF302 family)|uniref:DUF302 domain-containing protein n=1 Tax=Dyella jiangningensis TaxID=1379159 RepID=UPI00240EFA51|nr:DUF302 domain-containing protein [Dyella jiangningensis]MDG2538840.1 DUF302 domain-containing protein [Dyella jiangningensis]
MNYYFAKKLDMDFDQAIERVTEALKQEGFGIISTIDVQATLKQKIGVEFRPYRILGACNPNLAYEALSVEDKVGTMLPCNVVVQAWDKGSTEVAAIDPLASMQAIANPKLEATAKDVRAKLQKVVESL